MTRVIVLLALLCMSISNVLSQTNKTFFLGHSLMNFEIPNIVDKLSIEASQTFSYDANIGIGAPLSWHWNSPTSGGGDQWNLTLPDGGYENFIITEAVPLVNQLSGSTHPYVDSFYIFAQQENPDIQYYIYETWHCINSGDGSTAGAGGYPCGWDSESVDFQWRERLDIDLPRWESIADSINLIHPNPMLVIPGGQAMARLADSIAVGAVPGLSSIFDLFLDEHHIDSRGNYFIACVMYAVIHGRSPVGLPNQLTNRFGGLYTVFPTVAQAAVMQEIAWQTVCAYPRTGVSCPTLPVELVDFGVNKSSDSSVEIYWKTASETNSSFFQVERSMDGIRFNPLQRIAGEGTVTTPSTYKIVDKNPLQGRSYYRLKQVDYDGSFEYFNMVSINLELKTFVALRSKNIANQNIVFELIDVNPLYTVEVNLIATNGMLVKSELYREVQPNTNLDIDIRGLVPGLYYLKIRNGAEIFTRKIIVQ